METKDILKSLRKSNGYSTMQEFCAAADISFSTYQNYESGKRVPTAEILVKLADFYGVSTDYLLGRGSIGSLTPSQKEALALERWLSLDDGKRAAVLQMMQSCLDAYEAADKSKEIKQDDNG